MMQSRISQIAYQEGHKQHAHRHRTERGLGGSTSVSTLRWLARKFLHSLEGPPPRGHAKKKNKVGRSRPCAFLGHMVTRSRSTQAKEGLSSPFQENGRVCFDSYRFLLEIGVLLRTMPALGLRGGLSAPHSPFDPLIDIDLLVPSILSGPFLQEKEKPRP